MKQRLAFDRRRWWPLLCGAAMMSCISLGTAQADWEFTRWGMTQEDARAAGASFGLSPTDSTDEYHCSNGYGKALFKMPYRFEDIDTTACLLFDHDTGFLRQVMIRLPDASLKKQVAKLLSDKYGPPAKSEALIEDILATTLWLAPEDEITLHSGRSYAFLLYSPAGDKVGDGW
jgi:hypothetical protein